MSSNEFFDFLDVSLWGEILETIIDFVIDDSGGTKKHDVSPLISAARQCHFFSQTKNNIFCGFFALREMRLLQYHHHNHLKKYVTFQSHIMLFISFLSTPHNLMKVNHIWRIFLPFHLDPKVLWYKNQCLSIDFDDRK